MESEFRLRWGSQKSEPKIGIPNLDWDEVHQKAFNHIKSTIAKEVILAYADYSKVFEIYTDASRKQLGAVITQVNSKGFCTEFAKISNP